MLWLPELSYLLELFEERLKEKPVVINHQGLKATLDIVQWGMPFHPKPTIWDRVTILYRNLVEEHYFMDGNKRIGFIISVIFLNKNGYFFDTTNDDVYKMTMQVAQRLKTYEEILDWFKRNSKKI